MATTMTAERRACSDNNDATTVTTNTNPAASTNNNNTARNATAGAPTTIQDCLYTIANTAPAPSLDDIVEAFHDSQQQQQQQIPQRYPMARITSSSLSSSEEEESCARISQVSTEMEDDDDDDEVDFINLDLSSRHLYPTAESIDEAENNNYYPEERLASARSLEEELSVRQYYETTMDPMTAAAAATAEATFAFASIRDDVATTEEATVLESCAAANNHDSCQDWGMTNQAALEEARLAEMKRAAYYGGGTMVEEIPPPPPAGAGEEQSATVVSILEQDIHPSDISHDTAVQAELIGAASVDSMPTYAAAAAPTTASNDQASASAFAAAAAAATAAEASLETTTEEATVLDGCTAAVNDEDGMVWTSVPYTEEATILEDDRKPAAVETGSRQVSGVAFVEESQAEVVEIAADDYHNVSSETAADVAIAQEEEQQAEVVEISDEYHPAEGAAEGVAIAEAQQSVSFSQDQGVAFVQEQQGVAIAEAHQQGIAFAQEQQGVAYAAEQQAEVVEIADEYHPSEATEVDGIAIADEQVEGVAVAEEQAEVVDIAEEYHPSELAAGEAQAELIGHQAQATPVQSPSVQEVSDVVSDRETVIGEAAVLTTVDDSDSGVPSKINTSPRAVSFPDILDESPIDQPQCSRSASAPEVLTPISTFIDNAIASGTIAQPDGGEDENWTQTPHSHGSQDEFHPAYPQPTAPPSSLDHGGSSLPPTPPRSNLAQEERDTSVNSATSRSTQSSRGDWSSLQTISTNIARGTTSVMERLFGETNPRSRGKLRGFDPNFAASFILPRTSLPWSVLYSESTKMWVATVNTNQKALDTKNATEASRALRAFSVVTEKQAIALARSWTPPRMLAFNDNPCCFICESKFAVFRRRPCHCRNCGVCICSHCSVQWPSKMIPETYNIKKEATVNVCKACDWLCNGFRLALLQGDHDQAVALYATGNVNLYTPFANVKGELFYPVHCAVLGGSLKSLKWLVDENCCPVKSVRISKNRKDSSGTFTPILTSKGRSLLGIAVEKQHIGMIRYLVVEKGLSLDEEKDIGREKLIETLDTVLKILPVELTNDIATEASETSETPQPAPVPADMQAAPTVIRGESSSLGTDFETIESIDPQGDDGDESYDECIICFSNPINCVATPCGHQMCCLECSNSISRCPVCSSACSFMRVFRA